LVATIVRVAELPWAIVPGLAVIETVGLLAVGVVNVMMVFDVAVPPAPVAVAV
jgi:hypothetical protein